MSNGYGDYYETRAASMAAYDRLPPRLRRAVQVAVAPYAAKPILDALRAGISADYIVRAMVRGYRKDTLTTYGPTHPEARCV